MNNMGINIRKKLLSYKKSVVLIGLIVLIIGSVLLTVNIFAETPADCIGTNVSTQHCCTCLAITASPGTISVGESSTLTLFLDNNPDAPSEDCSANGFSSSDGTAVCSINNGVLSDTTFNDGSYSFSVSPSNTTTYTATCSGIGGTKTDNVTVTVIVNSPPTASISCDPSGCNSSDCIGYTGCPFTLNNDSTDPDGEPDIVKSEWDILGWGDSPDLTCTANPLCNYTVQAVTPDTYTIQLYVEDSVGNSDTATKQFTIRREASAGFVCSFNNEDWISCDDISPSQGQIIYLSDSQPSPLEHSSPSEGASSIVSRKWEIVGGAVFSQDNESNPQISLDENSTIKLTITDNQGRSDSQTHQIGVGLPLPEWQETAP